MPLDAGDLASIIAAAAVGGLGGTLIQQHRAVDTARRIRHDQEREAALRELVIQCATLEGHVDHMLSPDQLSPDGVFQTITVMGAQGIVRKLQEVWRWEAAPFLPHATAHAEEVRVALDEMVRTLGRTNPPVPAFFDRLRDLRTAAATLRADAQTEILRPTGRGRWFPWMKRRS